MIDPHARAESAQPILDLRQVFEVVHFAVESLRRHRWRIALLTAFTTTLTLPTLLYMPRNYTTTASVTARRESIMPALAHPRRSLPFYADDPAHLAPEMSLREDHLRELIDRVGLKRKFVDRRPDLLRFKDFLVDQILEPLDADEFERMLMGTIEQNVKMTTDKDVVSITGTWRDPDTAAELVDTLKVMFIEERHRLEVDPIRDTITLLQDEVRTTARSVDTAFGELRLLRQADKAESQRQARRLRSEIDSERARAIRRELEQKEAQRQERSEMARVQDAMLAKRRSIADLEATRSRQAMEIRAEIASLETRLGEKHPDRVAAQQSLQSLQAPPWELAALKREEEELTANFLRMGGRETAELAQAAMAPPPLEPRSGAAELLGRASEDEDEAVIHKRNQLRILLDQAQDLQDRLLGARLEQRVAEEAFRFRYVVLRAAEPPRKADKPQPALVFAGGGLSGLMLGILAALLRDIRSGRVFHAWQLERQTALPLLGDVLVS